MKINIVIVEDEVVIRRMLCRELSKHEDFEVVGEAGDGRGGLMVVEKLRPDVVLMDLGLPELNGIEATRRIVEHRPEVNVIVLSCYNFKEPIQLAFEAGAKGFVTKFDELESLAPAIRVVAAGKRYENDCLRKIIPPFKRNENYNRYHRISSSDREVIQLVAEKKTAKEIAQRLELSPRTIEWRIAELKRKLELAATEELITFAEKSCILFRRY